MHVYFYDSSLNFDKFSLIIAKIETKITDLGLNGKIIRLNMLHNLEKAIGDEIKTGHTLVFVGTDLLFSRALPIIAGRNLIIGYIPIDNKQPLARALGLPAQTEACEVLAARRVVTLDLGLANNQAFLSELYFKSQKSYIEIDSRLSLETKKINEIRLTNLSLSKENELSNPTDQLLELEITTKNSTGIFKKTVNSLSFFQHNNFLINSDQGKGLLDMSTTIDPPIKVSIMPLALNIIVGKERNF
jgi:diacylglycerol kinase family enzyme